MPQPEEKVYVGFIRSKPDKFGEVLDMGLTLKDLDLLRTLVDDRGWVNIKIRPRREPGTRGQTHSAVWLPPGTMQPKHSPPPQARPTPPPEPPQPPPTRLIKEGSGMPPRPYETAQTQGELPGTETLSNLPF